MDKDAPVSRAFNPRPKLQMDGTWSPEWHAPYLSSPGAKEGFFILSFPSTSRMSRNEAELSFIKEAINLVIKVMHMKTASDTT
jgi:hypothetical protein